MLQPLKIDLCEPLRRELPRFDPVRKLRHRRKGNVCIGGQRPRVDLAANEAIGIGMRLLCVLGRVPNAKPAPGCRLQLHFFGPVRRSYSGHGLPPATRGFEQSSMAQFDLHELLGFTKSGGRDFRSHRRRGRKCGRRAGRGVALRRGRFERAHGGADNAQGGIGQEPSA